MAILRAGPWGELGDEFQDPVQALVNGPDFSSSDDYLPAPVNCAKGNWPNQDWGAVYVLDESYVSPFFYPRGIVGLNEDVSIVTDQGHILISFCWQATEDFDIDLNWFFVEYSSEDPVYPTLQWAYQTIEGNTDGFFNTPSNSGTETATLPATTFGEFYFYIGGVTLYSSAYFDLTASIS